MAPLSPFEGVFFGKVILQRPGTKVYAIIRARVARSVDAFSIRFTRDVPREKQNVPLHAIAYRLCGLNPKQFFQNFQVLKIQKLLFLFEFAKTFEI